MTRSIPVLVLFLSVVGCGPKPSEQAPPSPTPPPAATTVDGGGGDGGGGVDAQCSVDADCVPAGCCHATSCVPAAQKPDCTDVMCTMECKPGTLDCGGRCACEAGSCKAVLGAP